MTPEFTLDDIVLVLKHTTTNHRQTIYTMTRVSPASTLNIILLLVTIIIIIATAKF